MYKEFDKLRNSHTDSTLALDWDGTTSDYPFAFFELAKRFDKIIIVTVNERISRNIVCNYLQRAAEEVNIFCCPDEKLGEVAEWKAQICNDENVALMFDDDPRVVRACHSLGVNAICVREREWKFEASS